ncbi:glucan endo-1,3-beta-D-glucosidase-like [Macadamia integrifolia]|uniref:glucan endo-1,3-beta-D-glucosidase-like n=1 Tax=Macadamia integrifolia TaxID=60698 RepID=UPI001C52DA8A|nr:glucan endo-1,3-beta-D-glucosidase-like [Macadamia integrifolia]
MAIKQSLAAFLCLVSACILLFLTVSTVAEAGSTDLKNNDNNIIIITNDTIVTDPFPTWCIAKPSTDISRLQNNINECCSKFPQVDCSVITQAGSCFEPNNLASQASIVMNLYYKAYGKNLWNCDFAGSGLIITEDPSWGTCVYPA